MTEKDTAKAQKLIPLSTIAHSELFQQLFEARFNIPSLTTPQLLLYATFSFGKIILIFFGKIISQNIANYQYHCMCS